MKGFTLTEVLVGLFILAVGVLNLLALYVISLRFTSNSRYIEMATTYINNEMETLKGKNFDEITSGSYTVESLGKVFQIERNVVNISDSLKKVTVAVTFDNTTISCSGYFSEKPD